MTKGKKQKGNIVLRSYRRKLLLGYHMTNARLNGIKGCISGSGKVRVCDRVRIGLGFGLGFGSEIRKQKLYI